MSSHLQPNPPGPADRQVSRRMLADIIAQAGLGARTEFSPIDFAIYDNGQARTVHLANSSPTFSGLVWVAGEKFDLTSSDVKDWIKVDLDAGTVTYDATGPASEAQFDDDTEWYRTAYTYGDLHVTRF